MEPEPEYCTLDAMSETLFLARCRSGAVFVYPTDTVYGLGGVADKTTADRINRLKGRSRFQALSVIVPDLTWVNEHLLVSGNITADHFSHDDGHPLTLLISKRKSGDYRWLSGNSVLGVRYLQGHRMQELVAKLGQPFITTSANVSGAPTVRSPDVLPGAIRKGVDVIVDGGVLGGSPSRLWDWNGQQLAMRCSLK